MSGSGDYTRTPRLGLYKPNYALDVGQWGAHLNLNADTLDAAWASDVANVTDFGADPTGVADSSAAFNAAAAQTTATGSGIRKTVYVPAGDYNIQHQVSLTGGQGFTGDAQGNSRLLISDSFDPAATSVIVCTGAVAADPGPTIRDLCFVFAQPDDATTRATFKTLAAGGTSHTGGTGVQYPWAIATSGNCGRISIRDVEICGSWNGINADAACFWIDGLRICSFNIGIAIGGTVVAPVADWAHLSDIQFWCFGLNNLNLQAIYNDGQTIAMRIGAQNGLTAQNISCFNSRLVFTSDASGGWFTFSNLAMDADGATIEITGIVPWLQITNLYSTTGTVATRPQISITGVANVTIANWYSLTHSPLPALSMTAGDVTILGLQALAYNTTSPAFSVSGTGVLRMNAARIFPGSASAWTVPLVQQSGTGGLQIDDAQIASSGSSGVAVRFATDTIYNVLGNVVLGAGWTTSVAAYVNGIYGPFAPTLNPVFGGTVTFTGAVNGFSFAPVVGGSTTDLSKQICLFAGAAYGFGVTANRINYNVPAASTHAFIVGGSDMGLVNANGITSNGLVQIGGISGPNWTQGSAAPAATAPVGSLYSRVGGAVGATLYVSRGGGTWAPVAGV